MDIAHSSGGAEPDVGCLLVREHAHLDRQFRSLLEAFEAGAGSDAAILWNQFDTDLQAHLLFEEEHLLPKFVDFNALEALALLREHQVIRDNLLALGVGVNLYLTRQDQVQHFLCGLRAHARREEKLLYAWAAAQPASPELDAFLRGRPAA